VDRSALTTTDSNNIKSENKKFELETDAGHTLWCRKRALPFYLHSMAAQTTNKQLFICSGKKVFISTTMPMLL
jgi:hypothetical protein